MKRGFTLLEVLLGLALLALLISLVQGAYSGAARSGKHAAARAAEAHLATLVLQQMARELSMAFFAPDREQDTGLELEMGADGNSSLRFSGRVPPIPGASPGGDVVLGYAVETAEDGTPQLTRRETPDLGADVFATVPPYMVLAGLHRFEVLCYDGDEWLASWASADRDQPPQLPLAVSVELAWGDGDEDAGREEHRLRVYRTSTPLYGAGRPP